MARFPRVNSYSLFPTCSPLPPSGDSVNTSLRRVKSNRERERADRTVDKRHSTTTNFRGTDLIPKPLKRPRSMDLHVPLKLKLKLDTSSSTLSRSIPDSPALPSSLAKPSTPKFPKEPHPGPETDLIVLPYTDFGWRDDMEEVKRLFTRGQYKHCSTRCKQILENAKEPSQHHPLYIIYLGFYCAISLEQTARSLHNHSSQKLPLLHEALTFYQQAASQLSYASFSTDPTILSYSNHSRRNSSSSSSLLTPASIRSSVDSTFSQTSASSSCSSISTSPSENDTPSHPHGRNPSLSSILSTSSAGTIAGSTERRKKKVSFQDLYPLDEQTIIAAFPSPPSQISPPPSSPPHSTTPTPTESQAAKAQRLLRFRTQLFSLTNQLSYHTTSMQALIADLSSARKPHRGSSSDVLGDLERAEELGLEMSIDPEAAARRREIEERIRRGRECGWERRRWDPSRYRALCEKVEQEIAGVDTEEFF